MQTPWFNFKPLSVLSFLFRQTFSTTVDSNSSHVVYAPENEIHASQTELRIILSTNEILCSMGRVLQGSVAHKDLTMHTRNVQFEWVTTAYRLHRIQRKPDTFITPTQAFALISPNIRRPIGRMSCCCHILKAKFSHTIDKQSTVCISTHITYKTLERHWRAPSKSSTASGSFQVDNVVCQNFEQVAHLFR